MARKDVTDSTIAQDMEDANDNFIELYANIDTIEADIALLGAAELPGQTDNAGKYLTTDGSTASWADLTELPDQDTNDGKILTTDGTDPSWTASVASLTLNECIITEAKYNQIADASVASGTHTFDYSAGDMQQLTLTGDVTLAFSNFPTGKIASMIIDAVNWGSHTVTHPAGILFEDGVAPAYTAAGTDRLFVIKDKDEVYGLFVVGQDIKVVS